MTEYSPASNWRSCEVVKVSHQQHNVTLEGRSPMCTRRHMWCRPMTWCSCRGCCSCRMTSTKRSRCRRPLHCRSSSRARRSCRCRCSSRRFVQSRVHGRLLRLNTATEKASEKQQSHMFAPDTPIQHSHWCRNCTGRCREFQHCSSVTKTKRHGIVTCKRPRCRCRRRCWLLGSVLRECQ